jgi:hypothetical protein
MVISHQFGKRPANLRLRVDFFGYTGNPITHWDTDGSPSDPTDSEENSAAQTGRYQLALAGNPETVVYAPVGSEYTNITTGDKFYKRSGHLKTGWARSVSVSAPPTVTGSRDGNAALGSLLTELASLGLITDGTTP